MYYYSYLLQTKSWRCRRSSSAKSSPKSWRHRCRRLSEGAPERGGRGPRRRCPECGPESLRLWLCRSAERG